MSRAPRKTYAERKAATARILEARRLERMSGEKRKPSPSQFPCGEAHPNATLTPETVRAIRRSRKSLKALAERYGVTASNVAAIRARRSWKHVA